MDSELPGHSTLALLSFGNALGEGASAVWGHLQQQWSAVLSFLQSNKRGVPALSHVQQKAHRSRRPLGLDRTVNAGGQARGVAV